MQLSHCSGLETLCHEDLNKGTVLLGGCKIDLHNDSFMRKTAESLH